VLSVTERERYFPGSSGLQRTEREGEDFWRSLHRPCYYRRRCNNHCFTGWSRGGESGHALFQSYAVANTATFLFKATWWKYWKKNTKYWSVNSVHDCQNAFSFRGVHPLTPWLGALPLDPAAPRPPLWAFATVLAMAAVFPDCISRQKLVFTAVRLQSEKKRLQTMYCRRFMFYFVCIYNHVRNIFR